MGNLAIVNGWSSSKTDVFWGEIAPCEHVVQIYENDNVFLQALAGFVGSGINAGECCLIIATDPHLIALEKLLTSCGVHVKDLISEKRYIPLNAEETLSRFMVNNWPDEKLFNETVTGLIRDCSNQGRKIRAFGEMVAILWAQGHSGATVQLEHLWNKFLSHESFCLFCAYPKSGFTDDINQSMQHICGSHSKMISGSLHQMTDTRYRQTRVV